MNLRLSIEEKINLFVHADSAKLRISAMAETFNLSFTERDRAAFIFLSRELAEDLLEKLYDCLHQAAELRAIVSALDNAIAEGGVK